MINSHLLYRLSYRGTAPRILLIANVKSTLPLVVEPGEAGGGPFPVNLR